MLVLQMMNKCLAFYCRFRINCSVHRELIRRRELSFLLYQPFKCRRNELKQTKRQELFRSQLQSDRQVDLLFESSWLDCELSLHSCRVPLILPFVLTKSGGSSSEITQIRFLSPSSDFKFAKSLSSIISPANVVAIKGSAVAAGYAHIIDT